MRTLPLYRIPLTGKNRVLYIVSNNKREDIEVHAIQEQGFRLPSNLSSGKNIPRIGTVSGKLEIAIQYHYQK